MLFLFIILLVNLFCPRFYSAGLVQCLPMLTTIQSIHFQDLQMLVYITVI